MPEELGLSKLKKKKIQTGVSFTSNISSLMGKGIILEKPGQQKFKLRGWDGEYLAWHNEALVPSPARQILV